MNHVSHRLVRHPPLPRRPLAPRAPLARRLATGLLPAWLASLVVAWGVGWGCGTDTPAGQAASPDSADSTDSTDSVGGGGPGDTAAWTGDGAVGGDATPSPDTGDAGDVGSGDAAEAPDVAGPDPTEALFPTDGLLEVAVQLDAADWDALRAESRNLADVLGTGCMDGPAPSPFTWFHATVTVGGTVDEVTVQDVAVRKKGFLGSLDFARPSLKLKFDKFVPGQEVRGAQRLTLNNDKQDPSKLAQCLTYGLFRQAGVPAPRCGFAHVTVNGQDLGVYTSVEPVKKAFLRRHFADDGGNLYEGTLSDFREGWTATFDKKTHESDPSRQDLEAAAAALTASWDLPDDQALAALAPFFDPDRFLTFWALEVITTHADGYASNTNNFFVYADPSPGAEGRFVFMPWGADATFLTSPEGAPPEQDPARAVYLTGALARRLYAIPSLRDAYVARLVELMDTVWDTDALLAQVDQWEALLQPHILPAHQGAFADGVAAKRQVIAGRRARLDAALAAGLPGEPPPARPEPCLQDKGTVDATFQTTWGTLPVDNLFTTGSGDMTVDLHDAALNGTFTPPLVGAKAGLSDAPDSLGRATLVLAGRFPDTSLLVVWLETDPALLVPGASIPVDFVTTLAQLLYLPPGATEPVALGFLMPGTLTLTAASQQDGGAVEGTLGATLMTW